MKQHILSLLLVVALWPAVAAMADDEPTINPTATFYTIDGNEEDGTSISGSAPLRAVFHANVENVGSWLPHYEWRFTLEGESEPYLVRYEEDTEYTFTKAGSHKIVLYAVFTQNGDTVKYTEDYWDQTTPLSVGISESRLEMPNAFSPNDDGINDYYQAKGTAHDGNGPQSIVEFEATIFNRWGQKIYSWTDCYTYEAGWDGTYKGKPVKQGVYFVLVKAKGADGRKFTIKRDVNLLRGYTEGDTYGDE